MDNVRSKIGFVWSNPKMAGRTGNEKRVLSFKYLKVQLLLAFGKKQSGKGGYLPPDWELLINYL